MRTTKSAVAGLLVGAMAVAGPLMLPGSFAEPAAAEVVVGDTPEPSWRVNGRVYAVKVVGDTVFVGGEFDTATGPGGAPEEVERLNLAAFDVNTGAVVEDWRADADAPVRALDARKGFLYVGGSFGEVGGKPRSRLAKVNVDTAAVNGTFAPRLDRGVRAVEVRGRAVYAGGSFTRVGRRDRRHVVKLGTGRGRVDRGFVANTSDPVWALVGNPASRTLYVAGRFNAVNGARRLGVAAVHSGSGRTRSVVFTDAARQTLGLAVNDSGSRLFTAGGTRENAVAAWRTTTGARVWRDRAMGDIQAIDFLDGTVYFGFHQGFAGDRCVKVLAASAGTGDLDPDFRPTFDRFLGVLAIDAIAATDARDAAVVVGGRFTEVSGVPAEGFARFVPPAGGADPAPCVTP